MYFQKKLYSPLCHLSYACMNACTRAYVDLKVCVSVCEQHGVSLTGAGQWVIIRPATSHLSKQSLYTHTHTFFRRSCLLHTHTHSTDIHTCQSLCLSLYFSLSPTHTHTYFLQTVYSHAFSCSHTLSHSTFPCEKPLLLNELQICPVNWY